MPAAPEPPPPPRRRAGWIALALVLAAVIVVVVILSTGNANPQADAGGVPQASASVDPPPAPAAGLHAAPGPFRVVLTWSGGQGAVPDGYTIDRDGRTIGRVGPQDHRFVDDEALPASAYRYEVRSYGGAFGEESRPVSVKTRTPAAPPATARLQGVYEIELKVTSSYGVTDVQDSTGAWRMAPDCDEGPCDVRMGDVNGPLPRIELQRSAAVYDGTATGQSQFQCGGVGITATDHLHLRVVKAAVVAGRWRASRLTGTLSVSLPQALGCRSGGVSYAVSAVIHEGS